jgi:hypothetical protein
MSDYISREDFEAVMQIAIEQFLTAIVNQRREFEDATINQRREFEALTHDYMRKIGELAGDLVSAVDSLKNLNRGLSSQLIGAANVTAVLSRIVLHREKISANAALECVEEMADDDPTALEFARVILGARPRLRIVATSDARASEAPGASVRARPSLSIVRQAPGSSAE